MRPQVRDPAWELRNFFAPLSFPARRAAFLAALFRALNQSFQTFAAPFPRQCASGGTRWQRRRAATPAHRACRIGADVRKPSAGLEIRPYSSSGQVTTTAAFCPLFVLTESIVSNLAASLFRGRGRNFPSEPTNLRWLFTQARASMKFHVRVPEHARAG